MKNIYFLLLGLCLTISASAQIINFPDANFKAKLISANSTTNFFAKNLSDNYFKIDSNNDSEIQVSEALQVSYLDIPNSNISSLIGISNFTNIITLQCDHNLLTSLNLVGLNNLQKLTCNFNSLNSLNTTGLLNLKSLYVDVNQFTSFDASGLINLETLYINANQLISLNVNGLLHLQKLSCYNNYLTSLNLNSLTTLDYLNCNSNQLQSIDITSLYNLQTVNCASNQLISIFIKNGVQESGLDFSGNPSLQFVCADENQLTQIEGLISFYGLINCHTNSYCSFTPGGNFYTIQGNHKYDFNANGCDVLDNSLPNMKFNITDGVNSGNLMSDNSGNYSISLQAGTHTVTPVLENPTYFNVSPSNAVVAFPTQASPFTQNFCVTANGIHPDLEVILMPIVPARPGFDAVYKLVYKNKGTNTQSGNINLSFNDAVLDFVSAIPTIANQTLNNLSWNFTNLQPFETREITLTLNVNSPMETPAVNGGDVLNYSSSITSAATDENPNDNIFTLNQTVVNSFDPNDKNCLEGVTIAPSEVGKYVHYLIRFENNGTANAQNIVVKDMIDTAKFDINSLVPIKGSHSFVTNITAGNKVEFIFENINLPFDDANNDGYVAFKIKTKPTLVAGNTFSNSANIYFDYNFPIVTNTAVTTIQALSTQDFDFGTYFTVYPNPVNNVLNIETKQTIEVSSVSIYNQLGQLVLVIPNAQNTKSVDVSSLSSGNYFIKINSDKGTSNTKFIKK